MGFFPFPRRPLLLLLLLTFSVLAANPKKRKKLPSTLHGGQSIPLVVCCCLKKNQNASRPSEYPPVRGKHVKTFRWDHRLLFLIFSVLVTNPKNYFTRWPIPLVVCWGKKRTKSKVWQHTTCPHPPRKKINNVTYLQALRRSRSVSRPYKDLFGSSTRPVGGASQNSTLPSSITSFPESIDDTANRHWVNPDIIGSRNCVPKAFTAESPPRQG